MRILVTGGAGYIGSHTCLELLRAGHEVVVIDNLSNSKAEALRRVQELRADHWYSIGLTCWTTPLWTPLSPARRLTLSFTLPASRRWANL